MRKFEYLRPTSVEEAVAAASRPGAAYLAGGTNLLDLMKTGAAGPELLVDVTRLPGLDAIEPLTDGGLRVGAMVRNADVARDAAMRRNFPMVVEALLSGASGQLRNMATVGGNLLQRTRCAWFQTPEAACGRRDPGAGCDARDQAGRSHAVLGWSERCVAANPSDFCVPLAALDAQVEIAGPGGRRDVALRELHRLPGDTPHVETALAPGELIVALRLPGAGAGFGRFSRYLKVRERTSYAFALVSAAAALRVEGGAILEARLALGGVAARPWRAVEAEAALIGAAPDAGAFRAAAEAALEAARPSGDNAFKIELARRTAARALALAAAGAPERMPALPASPFADIGAPAHA
ncbi:FAD binding domain-containing protein [Rubrimonas cliftonensis]|uniref:Xanthine dehydrogenase YagS FAD-binding subunit n=1 Tax=Rubrimonas cliftonensis TaxID=89524 RepID=A0A1H4CEB5_9RHOB|nr:xanthine dehydrogenase family protein subunit M [Rubrimonas cliftonensis]SEA58660.1 xanthine dehydrogenase YagS FAD-binding subunit [Rubrimonas cliftonensis]